ATTDRYATIDMITVGKVLKLIPAIRDSEHKKASTVTQSNHTVLNN
ncbi:unnamed protein product, partial [marine sediment metagenome]